MKNSLLLCLLCVACDPSTTPSPKEPHEPKVMQAPKDDIIIVVNPGWHEGKNLPTLTQSWRTTPYDKGTLNVDHQSNQNLAP